MENVSAFNNELSGLYDSKPPISKAKMAAITRAAMKAIKFYKHVVQSVEKFILKCKPEYKIPGLYVIDSIVRQSRHQFGQDKDVFAQRFARNVKSTFANLFRGAPEDKSRIIRVLNLWQKNNVFAPDVIQPLFDLADPNHPIYQLPPGTQDAPSSDINGMNVSMSDNNMSTSDDNHGIPDLSIGHQTANAKTLDQSTLRQLQHIQQILIRQTAAATESGGSVGVGIGSSFGGGVHAGANQSDSVKFNKKVLEYDYDEEEEHEEKSTSQHVPNLIDGNNLTQLLKDPNVLRQLQTLQQYKKQQEEKQIKLNEMRIQEEAFEKHLQNVLKGTSGTSGMSSNQGCSDNADKEVEFVSEDGKIEVINLDGNDSRSPTPDRDRYNKRRRTSRSRSRDRTGRSGINDRERVGIDRRRRSRSRSSRSRSPKGSNRRRGSSRDRNDRGGPKEKDRDKDKERDREYERERRRKGLPETKKDHLSVCSTTLWVGHLSKLVQQEELSDSFGKYGDIVSIDMIHPRGCAFIVMNRRQDAYKSMGSLKNHKMQGRVITISWAAGKGVKSKEWKDYWDLELGVSYIPWNKLNIDTDLETLEEGGMFDEDSMPLWMKEKINQKKNNREKVSAAVVAANSIFSTAPGLESLHNLDTTQPPPNSGVVPMMPPPGMPYQMGPPVPRMMGPMGMPPGLSGLPPMPPMVPGMPPPGMMPHGMMPPHGSMLSGFPPIPPPQMDKNMGSPALGGNGPPQQNDGPQFIGNLHMTPMPPHLGLPSQFQQPPPNQQSGVNNNSMQNNTGLLNDDQMDIEMEDELPNMNNILGGGKHQSNYNQPPPLFPNFPSDILSSGDNRRSDRGDDRRDIEFGGNRNRVGGASDGGDMHGGEFNNNRGSRWNERRDRGRNNRDGNGDRSCDQGPPSGWQENGMGNFQGPNFNDNGNGRSGMNIPPLDISNPPANPFFDMRDDYNDDRRGNNGPPRDFFSNNRFGGPLGSGGGPMQQMRGGPQFGPRLGNIFLRGNSLRNGPQGSGGGNFNHNFNDRPPFDREERGGNGGGRGMRGGNNLQERRGGRGNWRDDDDMMDRERGGGRRGGRFQNRDRSNDRGSRDRDRDRGVRDRCSRERGPGTGDRSKNRRNSSNRGDDDKQQQQNQKHQQTNNDAMNQNISKNVNAREQQNKLPQDTEDDWDQELEEFNINLEPTNVEESNNFSQREEPEDRQMDSSGEVKKTLEDESHEILQLEHQNNYSNENNQSQDCIESDQLPCENPSIDVVFVQPAPAEHHPNYNINKREFTGNFNNTPLYDEPNEGSSNIGNSQNQSANESHFFEKPSVEQNQDIFSNLTDSSNIQSNTEEQIESTEDAE